MGDLLAPETTPARVFPPAQPNVLAIPEALYLTNESQSTIQASVPISRLPPGDLLALETTPARALP